MTEHKTPWIPNHKKNIRNVREASLFDIAIVGGGITGISAAYFLRNSGQTVAVFDKGEVCSGDSPMSSAHLTEMLDERYDTLIRNFGLERAQGVAESNHWALGAIERISTEEGIACRFAHVPAFLYAHSEEERRTIEAEYSAYFRLGKPVKSHSEIGLPFRNYGAIELPRQAQFDPAAYVTSLARRCESHGVSIYEGVQILEVEDGEPCRLKYAGGEILAKKVLLATHAPTLNRIFLVTKVAAYRTYVVGFSSNLLAGRDGLYWDTMDPYHYIRSTHPTESTILVGGADHKTGTGDSARAYAEMREYAASHFRATEVSHAWSGQVFNSVDGLPFIGTHPRSPHIFLSTGYGGNGITLGTIGARLFSDWVEGRENGWSEIYRANRTEPLATVACYLSENKDFPLHYVKDRFKSRESVETLTPDSGAIVEAEGEKLAVYRDAEGELHAVSPVCPHMGCYVNWNSAERSWDCPCHGSRFDCKGKLLTGPATAGLEAREIPKARAVS